MASSSTHQWSEGSPVNPRSSPTHGPTHDESMGDGSMATLFTNLPALARVAVFGVAQLILMVSGRDVGAQASSAAWASVAVRAADVVASSSGYRVSVGE